MAGASAPSAERRIAYLGGAAAFALLGYACALGLGTGWREYLYDATWRKAFAGVFYSTPLVISTYLLNRALDLPRAENPAVRLVFLVATSALCSLALVLFLESDFLFGADQSDWLEIASACCLLSAIVAASRV